MIPAEIRNRPSARVAALRLLGTFLLVAVFLSAACELAGFRPQDLPGTRLAAVYRVGSVRGALWLGGGLWPVVEFSSVSAAGRRVTY